MRGTQETREAVLWEDGELVLRRAQRTDANGKQHEVLALVPGVEYPTPATIARLNHEFALREYLDEGWAVRPLELVSEHGATTLFLESPPGSPLGPELGRPLELGRFLRLSVALASALGHLHRAGLVHKDVKPHHLFVDPSGERIRLCGFGLASRTLRERRAPEPLEQIGRAHV